MQTEKEKLENYLEETEHILKKLNISFRQASRLLKVNKNAFYNAKIRPNSPTTKEFQNSLLERIEEPFEWINDYADEIEARIGGSNINRKWTKQLKLDIKFVKKIFCFDTQGLLELYLARKNIEIWNQEFLNLDSCSIENKLINLQQYVNKMKESNLKPSEWSEFALCVEDFLENLEKINEVMEKMEIAFIKQSIAEEKVLIFILEKVLNEEIVLEQVFTAKEIKSIGKEIANFFKEPSKENRRALQRFLEERKELLKKKELYQEEELTKKKAS